MKLPKWCESWGEMLMFNLIITEPPMATLAQMQDGTYSVDDVLTMNLLLQYKQDRIPRDN